MLGLLAIRVLAIGVAGLVTLTGCSLVGDGGNEALNQSRIGSDADSLVLTPIQIKNGLEELEVFHSCQTYLPPAYSGPPVSVIRCFLIDQGPEPPTRASGPQTFAVIARDQWDVVRSDACGVRDFILDETLVVTDFRSFFVLGSTGEGRRGESGYVETLYREWPVEVWPEDIQTALGGVIVARSEFCN